MPSYLNTIRYILSMVNDVKVDVGFIVISNLRAQNFKAL